MISNFVASLVRLSAFIIFAAASKNPPEIECKSASGQTACGYHCKEDNSQVQCAKTPQGICVTSEGKPVCFDPPLYVIRWMGERLPKPECQTHDGSNIFCGYHCIRDLGVGCSKTPQGICRAEGGQVRCFDPPPSLFALYRDEIPKPECKKEGSYLECGYHCTTNVGLVRCARTPQGICRAGEGNIICFDPKPSTLCAYGLDLPRPECVVDEGKVACGYHCLTGHHQIACAGTPEGTCHLSDSSVVCFDPPADNQGENPTRATCLEYLSYEKK